MAKIDKTEAVENAPRDTETVASKTSTVASKNVDTKVLFEDGHYVTPDGSKFNTLKKAEQHLKQ